jgi:hypothetical protein
MTKKFDQTQPPLILAKPMKNGLNELPLHFDMLTVPYWTVSLWNVDKRHVALTVRRLACKGITNGI